MGILDPEPFKLSNVVRFLPIIGNAITNHENNQLQIDLQEDAQQWNAEQATIAWQRGLEQWNRENEYNSPVAQMQRLREAGINPALAYSNGAFNQAATSPDAPVPAPARAAPTQAFQIDPLTFANIGVLNAQRDLLQSQSEAISVKLPEEVQNLQQYRKESDAKIGELNQTVRNLQEQIKNFSEERRLLVEKRASLVFERSMATLEFQRKCRETTAVIKELASRVLVNEADADLKKSAKALNWQEYSYNIEANAYRLAGLRLDNEIKGKIKVNYDDQHVINHLNAVLLGYDVTSGYASYDANRRFNQGLKGNGVIDRDIYRGINSLIAAYNLLLSPLENMISVSF